MQSISHHTEDFLDQVQQKLLVEGLSEGLLPCQVLQDETGVVGEG